MRGGYDLAQKESADLAYIYGPTFGAGIRTALGSTNIPFDYAYRSVKV